MNAGIGGGAWGNVKKTNRNREQKNKLEVVVAGEFFSSYCALMLNMEKGRSYDKTESCSVPLFTCPFANLPSPNFHTLMTRIFENIPVNDETAFSRATLINCYVDEANNCRRIFTLGPQPGTDIPWRSWLLVSVHWTSHLKLVQCGYGIRNCIAILIYFIGGTSNSTLRILSVKGGTPLIRNLIFAKKQVFF